jgi:hypothetical protein
MDPTRRGLSTGGKATIIVIVIIVVVGGIYFAPSALGRGKNNNDNILQAATATTGGNRTFGLLPLFGYFSQMEIRETTNSPQGSGGGSAGAPVEETLNYTVLGQGTFDGTPNVRVEFSQVGVGNDIIAWFNASGIVDVTDIIGQRTYSGPGAAVFAQTYTSAFLAVTEITNNATLLSLVSKTAQNTTSIGPTTLAVSTYKLKAATAEYRQVTVEYATIPGTSQKLAVYLSETSPDGVQSSLQVLSLKSS